MDPKYQVPQGAKEIFALNTIDGGNAHIHNVDISTSVANVVASTHDVSVEKSTQNQPKIQIIMEHPSETTDLPHQKTNKPNSLIPTPIDVNLLENALMGHPDPEFVFRLCQNLGHGARIGFQGQRSLRFSKNLPTALADPNVVSSNLAAEVSLGRVAGLFVTPPFPNFQVSPIGLIWYQKRIRTSFARFFIFHFRNQV